MQGDPFFHDHAGSNPKWTEVDGLEARCRTEMMGEVEVKSRQIEALETRLPPIRQRRSALEGERALFERGLADGTQRARQEAQARMSPVRRAMGDTGILATVRGCADGAADV